jgi:hypothetical protein
MAAGLDQTFPYFFVQAGGTWLRILITVDAMIVLCGTVLTGMSFQALFEFN